ncbi:MAG: hypothetical protein K8T10_06225 [Candidatus Eremiobacteraeota bacterium]|nr:hypothetical protein [Candidatus Eremiobacteraeota bacterium]
MEIRSTGNDYNTKSPGAGKVDFKPQEPEELGYQPLPDDSYDSGDKKKGFFKRTADGIRKFINKNIIGPADRYKDNLKSDFGTQAMTAGGVVGGAVGAMIGHSAAGMEEAHMQSDTLTWQEPTMQREHLGNIPRDYYSWSRWDFRSHDYDSNGALSGGSRVYRNAPVYNSDGSARVHDVTETIDSKRFGKFAGTSMGLALGTVAGVMGGFAVAMIRKIITSESAKG